MRILGIDPGSNATGFGVVDLRRGRLQHVDHGVLRPPRGIAMERRLAFIHAGIARIVGEHRPDQVAIERVFLAANPRSALVLGQARGVALAAFGAAELDVAEWAAREVKKAVVGTGSAGKGQVQAMVKRLLGLDVEPASDAADALAIAICQAHSGRLAGFGTRRRRPRRARTREALHPTRLPS